MLTWLEFGKGHNWKKPAYFESGQVWRKTNPTQSNYTPNTSNAGWTYFAELVDIT